MYNSQYYTCEQVDQRLLQGYLDDYNTENGTSLTKAQFLQMLSTIIGKSATVDNLVTQLGYYVCETSAATAAKEVSATGYILSLGGSIKIKMTNANTADNATLNINSTGEKALYYDGERASSINTWEAGETVEIYYDGTSYYANNVAGGSGSGDGVFDVSEKYPTSGVEGGNTYTLAGAIAVLNANLSASKKKGGMSIKFIQGTAQSSDNKYVQYRFMLSTFTAVQFANPDNWQGVVAVPTTKSKDLVQSNGVAKAIELNSLILGNILDFSNGSNVTIEEVSNRGRVNKNGVIIDASGSSLLRFRIDGNKIYKFYLPRAADYTSPFAIADANNNIDFYWPADDKVFDKVLAFPNVDGYILLSVLSNKLSQYSVKAIDITGDILLRIKDGSIPLSKLASGTVDNTPTENSDNLVKSGGVYSAIYYVNSALTTNIASVLSKTNKVEMEFIEFVEKNCVHNDYTLAANSSGNRNWAIGYIVSIDKYYILKVTSSANGTIDVLRFRKTDNTYTVNLINQTGFALTKDVPLYFVVRFTEKPDFLSSNNSTVDLNCELYDYTLLVDKKLANYVPVKLGNNLFDKDSPGIIEGKYLTSNGGTSSSSSYDISGYVAVEAETQYYIGTASGSPAAGGSSTYLCYYNGNKEFITSDVSNNTLFTTPANCAFIRITIRSGRMDKLMVVKGNSVIPYEPYSIIGGYPIVLQSESIVEGYLQNGCVTFPKIANENISRLRPSSVVEISSIESGGTYTDSDFPQTLKKNRVINLNIPNLTAFSGIYVGWGKTQAYGVSFYVDATNIYVVKGAYNSSRTLIGAHGLTVSTFLSVSIICSNSGNAKVIIGTLSGSYTADVNIGYYNTRGASYIMSDSTTGTGATLTSSSIDLSKNVWVFGDSYLGISSARWPYYIHKLGINNVSWFAYPGASTENQYEDFVRALVFGKPKYLVWCLGMNNSDSTTTVNSAWQSAFDNVKSKCEQYHITLILATIPNVSNSDFNNIFKNDIVRNSGYRYIDFAKSVNAESAGSTWYDGMLSSDNIHPTALGAETLAHQVLKDFPEILMYDNLDYTIDT